MVRKFFATFLVFLFASLSAPLLFAWQIESSFTDPEFYTDDFYASSRDLFVDESTKFIIDKDLSFIDDDAQIASLVDLAVDQDNFNKILKNTVNQFWNTDLNGASEVKITFDFVSSFSGNKAFYDALFSYMEKKLPPCIPEQVVSDPWECFDPKIAKDDFEAKVKATLDREVFASVPNEFVLDLPFAVPDTLAHFSEVASATIFTFYFTVLTVLLGALALVIYRPWQKIVLWEASTIFFSVFHLVILSFLTIFLFRQIGGPEADLLNSTFGLIAEKLLYYYAMPIGILAVLVWLLVFMRLRNTDTTI